MNLLVSLVFSNFMEIVRQPFYYIILLSGCFIILMSFGFTFFAFGEESRMIRDMAVSTITICGLLSGCLSSSIMIAGEFERQTVLIVLSKPVSKVYFILGKYLGILAATFLIVFFQGFVLEVALIMRNYNTIQNDIANLAGLVDLVCILGIAFSLLQIMIMTTVSLVVSLYFNTIANLTICLFFFICCNAFSYILPIHSYGEAGLSAIITICYTVFPNFQNLNMAAINKVVVFPALLWKDCIVIQYVVYNIMHSTIYCIAVMWVAVFLFKRKEIA
ncbi:ABC transporter permease [Candidatus Scalindua japonica]|uniref:ABC transporter permease n=1 Tax=Candidatus Scalindua japonica TaxID=1284222 RepID=UPI001054AB49|nr:ABC transporter permease [Candidatus Scalindua japonica]